MPRHRLLAALIFLSCVRLSAQSGTLTVKVRDAATEEPVRQAQVMLSTFGGGADSHRALRTTQARSRSAALAAAITTSKYGLRAIRRVGRASISRSGAMQSADVALRSEQKSPQAPPGPTASADELAIPKQARKHFEEGMKKIDSDPQERCPIVPESDRRVSAIRARVRNAGREPVSSEASWTLPRNRPRKPPRSIPRCRCLTLCWARSTCNKTSTAEQRLNFWKRPDSIPKSWEAPYELARCYYSTEAV